MKTRFLIVGIMALLIVSSGILATDASMPGSRDPIADFDKAIELITQNAETIGLTTEQQEQMKVWKTEYRDAFVAAYEAHQDAKAKAQEALTKEAKEKINIKIEETKANFDKIQKQLGTKLEILFTPEQLKITTELLMQEFGLKNQTPQQQSNQHQQNDVK